MVHPELLRSVGIRGESALGLHNVLLLLLRDIVHLRLTPHLDVVGSCTPDLTSASRIDTSELQGMLTDGLLVGRLNTLEVSFLVITYLEANGLHLGAQFMGELLDLG